MFLWDAAIKVKLYQLVAELAFQFLWLQLAGGRAGSLELLTHLAFPLLLLQC